MSAHPLHGGGPGPVPADDPFAGLSSGDGLDLDKYLGALRRRWPLLLLCCLVLGSGALLRYLLTTKEYRASARIQIERKRLSVLALGQASYLEDWWNMEYYPTQYLLLQSRGMAERVVEELRLDQDPVFLKAFRGRGKEGRIVLDDEAQSHSLEDDKAALAGMARWVQSRLQVTPIRGTQLVDLSFRSPSAELAAKVANGYAQAFIRWGIEKRSDTVSRASSVLAARSNDLKEEIQSLEERLQSLSQASEGPLDPADEALLGRRQALENQRNSAFAERLNREAAFYKLQELGEETIANTHSGGRVSEIQGEILDLESEYNTGLETYLPEYPAMVQLRQDIEDRRTSLRQRVREWASKAREEAWAEYQKALAQERRLEQEVARLQNEASSTSSAVVEYRTLRETIAARQEVLNDLVRRQSETAVVSGDIGYEDSNVRLVDRAVRPGGAFRPVLQRDLGLGLGLGLLLGIAAIALLEFLDRTIKSPDELEKFLGVPTLAVVPDLNEGRRSRGRAGRRGSRSYGYGYGYGYNEPSSTGSGRARRRLGRGGEGADGAGGQRTIELLPHHQPRLAVCEAYRSLRTALMLSTAQELRVVALTSAEPGEGKTATTSNLGVVMAQMGRRVLVIDADLRRPRLHKVFAVSNRVGVVNHLTGGAEPDKLFQETKVPNLYVCACGPIPPNPSELLASDRMRQFLEEVRRSFDFVLVDTPPTLPVADAVLIGAMADGTVVCGRAGSLRREDAKACREQLAYADVRLLGSVLNRYRSTPGGFVKRYHYYGGYEQNTTPSSADTAA